jgi:signal-transduction protein with cAMP-binding, CBS, and nucleotidyltransferase domain
MKRNLIYLDVETLLEDIFELVSANKSNLMLVTENGQHIGVLDTENLLSFFLKGKIKTSLCLNSKSNSS